MTIGARHDNEVVFLRPLLVTSKDRFAEKTSVDLFNVNIIFVCENIFNTFSQFQKEDKLVLSNSLIKLN